MIVTQNTAEMLQRLIGWESVAGREFPAGDSSASSGLRIVGVVADFRAGSIDEEAEWQMYLPYTKIAPNNPQRMLVKTQGDPMRLVPALRDAIRQTDPFAIVDEVQTLEQVIARAFSTRRFMLTTVTGFSLSALVLAALGLYGLVAYSAQRRTKEIGIRMACGAAPRDIPMLIAGRGLVLTSIGAALGLAGAYATSRFLESMLYGVERLDLITYGTVLVAVLSIAAAAAAIPAWRTARRQPIDALQGDP